MSRQAHPRISSGYRSSSPCAISVPKILVRLATVEKTKSESHFVPGRVQNWSGERRCSACWIDTTYCDPLVQLVAEKEARRNQTRLGRGTRSAHFPFLKAIDDFDFSLPSTLRQLLLASCLGTDIVTEGRSLIPCGKNGPWEDALSYLHRIPGDPERFRESIYDCSPADRRPLDQSELGEQLSRQATECGAL